MSVAWQLRLAREPIPVREPLDPKLAERWIAQAETLMLADPTFRKLLDTRMIDGTRIKTSLRVRLRNSDNAWVLDGAPRLAGPEALAEAALTTARAVAVDLWPAEYAPEK